MRAVVLRGLVKANGSRPACPRSQGGILFGVLICGFDGYVTAATQEHINELHRALKGTQSNFKSASISEGGAPTAKSAADDRVDPTPKDEPLENGSKSSNPDNKT